VIFYIAAKWEEREVAARLARSLQQAGHRPSHPWWDDQAHFPDPRREAEACIRGVREADVLIAYMVNSLPYQGVWVEIGAALASGRPVYLIGPKRGCLFEDHPLVVNIPSSWVQAWDVYALLEWGNTQGGKKNGHGRDQRQ
jgi:nucleoside 2-deoxyribosyltransferase